MPKLQQLDNLLPYKMRKKIYQDDLEEELKGEDLDKEIRQRTFQLLSFDINEFSVNFADGGLDLSPYLRRYIVPPSIE